MGIVYGEPQGHGLRFRVCMGFRVALVTSGVPLGAYGNYESPN